MPARETVAGDAWARFCTSKSREICGVSAIRSPLISVRTLLSSRTVFIDSIQSVSTGPSRTTHFSFVFSLLQQRRRTAAMIPSDHSRVFRSYDPYSSLLSTVFGLITNDSTRRTRSSVDVAAIVDSVFARMRQAVDLPDSASPTTMFP